MSKTIVNASSNDLSIWDDQEKLKDIKNIYGKNLTDGEFKTFIQVGMASGLNPFTNEIWAVKYGDRNPAQIFCGLNGYRRVASEDPRYDGHIVDAVYSKDTFRKTSDGIVHEYHNGDRGVLLGAYCEVYRKDTRVANYVWASLSEYDKGKSVWASHKEAMIKKVAESQCIRMAFPSKLNATYEPSEMSQQPSSPPPQRKPEKAKIIEHEEAEVVEVENEPLSDISYEEITQQMEEAKTVKEIENLGVLARDINMSIPQREKLLLIYKERRDLLKGWEEF